MTSGAECKNCGATIVGRYCSACGQAADVRIPSFGGLVLDALGDVFNFDSRVWRSLTALMRPGRLTRRFLDCQRAGYTPPFRLYIVTSLVFFAIFSLGGGDAGTTAAPSAPVIDTPPGASPPGAGAADTAPAAATPAPDAADPSTAPTNEKKGFGIDVSKSGWSCNLDRDMNPAMRARLLAACKKMEGDNGASYMRAFASHIPMMMLVIIPLVAALMKLLYLFSRRKYVEHLVFFIHAHTFFFLTGTVSVLMSRLAGHVSLLAWPARIAAFAAWTYFLAYFFLAMRHVYRQGRVLTAVKYVVLGIGYFFATIVTLLGLIIYTAVTL